VIGLRWSETMILPRVIVYGSPQATMRRVRRGERGEKGRVAGKVKNVEEGGMVWF
jgi:hypothetical protein